MLGGEEAALYGRINDDLAASEVSICLFVAAVNSYKADSVVRPFPPQFLGTDGEKDFEALREVCHSLPSVTRMVNSKLDVLSEKQKTLVEWVLMNQQFSITSVKDTAEAIAEMESCTHSRIDPRPSHVMRCTYSRRAEERFNRKHDDNRNLLYGFHGSAVHNFHSILQNGFLSSMNKTSVFGIGTYISEESSLALAYCQPANHWIGQSHTPSSSPNDNNTTGDESENNDSLRNSLPSAAVSALSGVTSPSPMSVLAFCELVDHPSVKRQASTSKDKQKVRTSNRAPESEAGEVPDRYMVVTDNEVVRVKYLLIYSDGCHAAPDHSPGMGLTRSRTAKKRVTPSWYRRHPVAITILFYALLLLCIGLANSRQFRVHVRSVYHAAARLVANSDPFSGNGDLI